MNNLKYISAFLFLSINFIQAQAPSAYLFFDAWPVVKLNGEKLLCGDYVNVFTEEFNDVQHFNDNWRKHLGTDPTHGFVHENDPATSVVFSADNVVLNTTAVTGAVPGQVEITTTEGPITALSSENIYITRAYAAGLIQMKQHAFTLGKYKFRTQFTSQDHIWNTFWMYHSGMEIDIVDVGFGATVNHNVFNGNMSSIGNIASQILNSPCNPYMTGCDFCPQPGGIDCPGLDASCTNTSNPEIVDWPCNYLSNGFHEFECEWTPYRISFSIDGYETGVVYRYYYLDKTPVIIECGDQMPDGVVKENPSFASQWQGAYMLPIIFQAAESDTKTSPTDVPATLLVDNFIIDERAYKIVSLDPSCYKLCKGEETCVKLNSKGLNFKYAPPNDSLPQVFASSFEISLTNATITTQNSEEVCFIYTGPGCPDPESCSEEVCIQANLVGGGSLTKCLYPPQAPQFYAQCKYQSLPRWTLPTNNCFCIDLGNNCDAIVSVNGEEINTEPKGGLQCLDIGELCGIVDVQIDNCGTPLVYSSECAGKFECSETITLDVSDVTRIPDCANIAANTWSIYVQLGNDIIQPNEVRMGRNGGYGNDFVPVEIQFTIPCSMLSDTCCEPFHVVFWVSLEGEIPPCTFDFPTRKEFCVCEPDLPCEVEIECERQYICAETITLDVSDLTIIPDCADVVNDSWVIEVEVNNTIFIPTVTQLGHNGGYGGDYVPMEVEFEIPCEDVQNGCCAPALVRFWADYGGVRPPCPLPPTMEREFCICDGPGHNGNKAKLRKKIENGAGLSAKQLWLYPNPATDLLTIKMADAISYKIFDHQGILWQSGTISNRPLNIRNLLPGVYYISVILENGAMEQQQFVKITNR